MIDVRRGMAEVRQLQKEGYSAKMLAIMIGEAFIKHNRGDKLTLSDRFILGLRYSEFLAIEDTAEAYAQAEIKRQEYLKKLGLTVREINELCSNICGLH